MSGEGNTSAIALHAHETAEAQAGSSLKIQTVTL
jgi:hypothetical protein